jgi:DNA processing protein
LKALAQTGFAEFLQQEKRLAGMNVDWVTRIHASYPALVDRFSADAPGVLFMYGNQRLLEANTFAVLSSRSATVEELEQIESLTEVGILNGEVLVSGHNRLEYQRSAIVPLRWGTPRILCADRGLFSVLGQDLKDEAFRAARLWRYEFDPKTDLVVSPFAPDAGSNPASNRQRDALVAALCKRLDFVRISPKGNMESLARTAIRDGRKVRVPAKELERFAGATALERS